MDRINISSFIKNRAQAFGFDLAGMTRPFVSEHAEYLRHSAKLGSYRDMKWFSDTVEKRIDMVSSFRWARSVIMLGTAYRILPERPRNRDGVTIGSYARITDYHKVLFSNAERFLSALESALGKGIKSKIYVDTGPLLEKETAMNAGLGFIGKNTLLIHPELGSSLFLAEILTDIEIPFENPRLDHSCGDCTSCIRACPSGALQPYRLDPSRCISWLTIEYKGIIPDELKPKIGHRAFGCDICQQVCPYNNNTCESLAGSAFFKSLNLPENIMDLLFMNEEQFTRMFRDYPIFRAGHDSFIRNLLICLGNSGESPGKAEVERFLENESIPVRDAASYALKALGVRNGADEARTRDLRRDRPAF